MIKFINYHFYKLECDFINHLIIKLVSPPVMLHSDKYYLKQLFYSYSSEFKLYQKLIAIESIKE